MLIDTHCHLDFKDFDPDRDDVLKRAHDAGVVRIINIGSSLSGSRRSVELSEKYEMVYASVGVHPHEASSVDDKVVGEIERLAAHKKVVAIGEVGLDYYRNLSPKDAQVRVFKRFIALAQGLGLPLIIHSREAEDDLIGVLKESRKPLKGVIHCFSGDEKFLKNCLDLGFYISFTCNLTFKKADRLREVARKVPPERLFLETDAPYLAPEGFRGKRNESSYLKYLVDEWSKLLGLSGDDIARITTHNANSFFGLKLEEVKRIAYPIRQSLYLNITNKCTNKCDFCVRNQTEFVKGHNLKLEKDPSVAEILDAAGDVAKYKEVVFCGYGEPTSRLDTVKEVAKALKKKGSVMRLVTNGHGDLINGRPIAGELIGLIDKVSVSLNTDTEAKYLAVCKPEFGAGTYPKIVSFIKDCVRGGIDTEVTYLDLSGVDIKKCESMAREMGARFRLRHIGVVG